MGGRPGVSSRVVNDRLAVERVCAGEGVRRGSPSSRAGRSGCGSSSGEVDASRDEREADTGQVGGVKAETIDGLLVTFEPMVGMGPQRAPRVPRPRRGADCRRKDLGVAGLTMPYLQQSRVFGDFVSTRLTGPRLSGSEKRTRPGRRDGGSP
jgi:hypothetical protein